MRIGLVVAETPRYVIAGRRSGGWRARNRLGRRPPEPLSSHLAASSMRVPDLRQSGQCRTHYLYRANPRRHRPRVGQSYRGARSRSPGRHDGHRSLYSAQWLRDHCYSEPERARRRTRPKLWDGRLAQDPPRADLIEAEAGPPRAPGHASGGPGLRFLQDRQRADGGRSVEPAHRARRIPATDPLRNLPAVEQGRGRQRGRHLRGTAAPYRRDLPAFDHRHHRVPGLSAQCPRRRFDPRRRLRGGAAHARGLAGGLRAAHQNGRHGRAVRQGAIHGPRPEVVPGAATRHQKSTATAKSRESG